MQRPLPQPVLEPATLSSETEGNLVSEDEQLQEQARKSRIPEEGKNLLEENPRQP